MDDLVRSTLENTRRARSQEGFSLRRLGLVAGLDLAENLRRPLFWLWAAMMAWNGFLMSRGAWFFRSIDTSLGGAKAWVDSEFQIAYVSGLVGFLVLSFFVTVAAGMPLIRDGELKVGPVLLSTPLKTSEYVWGKFLAALASCLAAVALLPLTLALFSRALPNPETPDFYGPFDLLSYIRPILVFVVPAVVLTAGAAFALGRFSNRPIVVFLLPIIIFLFYNSFGWRAYPPDFSPGLLALLRYADPSGFRWLKETWLFVDRGLEHYNTRPVGYDLPFLLSRVGIVLAGLGLVDLSRRRFGASPRAARAERAERQAPEAVAAAEPAPLASLGMTSRLRGALSGALTVARFELAELRSQPGLYIFVPAILVVLYIAFTQGLVGYLFSPVLLTPGLAATVGLALLTILLTLLLLFYTVESLQRERSTGMAALYYATPVPTSSVLAGKALANVAVIVVSLAAAFLVALLVMAQQGWAVGMDLTPFLILWGLLLLPTLILWTAFVSAVYAVTQSRYGTYGVGIAALAVTGFFISRGEINWVGNWLLYDSVRWSDMGPLDLDLPALVLNRAMALSLAALFLYVATRFFGRRDRDRLHPLLKPAERRRVGLNLAGLAVIPLALGVALWILVNQGFQGAGIRKKHEDYWRQNLATWIDAPLPYVTHVDMDLELEPARRGFTVAGSYDLENRKEGALIWFPVTGGSAWEGLSWTLDGKPAQPENRAGLYVFRLAKPLARGESIRLGFRYRGTLLGGISRNGGEVPLGEFILPSGTIVTGRNPDFVPVVGYVADRGVDEKNRYEPKIYPPDFYVGVTDSDIDRSAFIQRLRITAPAEYTVNSTGVMTSEVVKAGRRTVVWESDYPVRVFNVAAGRWAVKRGQGTAVFYHPGHEVNVASLSEALEGARRWYSEWFGPYPWRELRLNEFPAVADYARGNATNIFFSEGTGFLSQRTPESDSAFTIAAHEAAHQWWGHILAPGEGPGGIIMAEGTANFSTILLLDQLRGLEPRIRFATRIEAFYGENRQPSSEKALAETLQFRPADTTVIYDKGGWVFWMMLNNMGRDAFFAGTRNFIATWHGGPDYPVIQDFVAAMRPYASDPAAYDDFCRQWFFERVIPEYRIEEASRQQAAGGGWQVAVRVRNAGTGRMPVEVAATRGRRFDGKGGISPDYRDARATVVLGAGEERVVEIRCPFEPERVVVDPDAKVLQLQRNAAAARL